MKRSFFILLLMVLPVFVSAESCDQLITFDITTGEPSENEYATVMSHKAKVYEKNKVEMVETDKFVHFNHKYKITGRTKKHFKLEKSGDEIGYVKISDLFCGGGTPLKAESGLMKKFYVKTDVYNRDDKIPSYVNAYQSSTTTNCGKDGREFCNPLKRFNSYFIYKEENGRFLLATSNSFKGNRDYLTGWVDKSNGYIWKTAIGARPSEKLSDEEPIYFYKNEQDAINKTNGNPILGGNRWFNLKLRMPILDKKTLDGKEYYEVAISTSGIGVKRDSKGNIFYTEEGNDEQFKTFDQFKYVDIMFLVDGTESMQPYLDKITAPGGTIDQLSKKLKNEPAYKDLVLRISYRVYRDDYAKEKNLNEGVSLNGKCKKPYKKLKKIYATKDDAIHGDKTAKENLYGGISKAIEDMETCSDNKKIIFVIGDTGDNDDNTDTFNRLVKKLKEKSRTNSTGRHSKNTLMVFVQTPRKQNGTSSYNNAYDSFTKQANKFTKALDPKNRGIVTSFKSNDKALINKILKSKTIQGYLDYSTIDIIKKNLKDGQNLKETIEKLRMSTTDTIPAIYYDEIISESCKELGGTVCQGNVYNVVAKGYIEATDDIREDIFFLDSDFDKLSAIMNHLRFESTKSRDDARKDLALILKQSLGEVTGQSFLTNEENNRIDEFLNRGGIPTRENSPLFKHRISDLIDLSNESPIKDCNVKQLSNWVLTSKSILKIVGRNKVPILKPIKVQGCDKEMPKYDEPIMSDKFPNDYSGYEYTDKQQGLRYLWVPKEYLP